MRSIKNQLINIPGEIIEQHWDIYKQKYLKFEARLENSSEDSFFYNKVHSTGAFKFHKNNKLEKTPLYKTLISEVTNLYTIKKGDIYLLRGINYFPDMLPLSPSEKFMRVEKSLLELFKLVSSADLLKEDLLIYLATIDYVKNYLLILLHILHILQTRGTKILDLVSEYDYYKFQLVIENVAYDYITTWESRKPFRSPFWKPLPTIIVKVLNAIKFCINDFHQSELDAIDLFRSYRENNHPTKLLSFSKELACKYLNKTLLVGIEYGGIELPFLINAYRSYLGKDRLPKIIIKVSKYSEISGAEIESIFDTIPMFLRDPKLEMYHRILLLDDSITTGRTIASIISLLPSSVKEVYLATLSATFSNRYHHLIRSDHGGINPIVLDLMFSKYKSMYTSTYTKKSYTNKSGIFNKEKHAIKLLLRDNYFKQVLKNG